MAGEAFKCHRHTLNGEDYVWPVNSLAFHPVCVTRVCPCAAVTDPRADTTSSRRRQYLKYALGVQDIAFNADGSWVTVEVSYSWEHGEDTPFILFGGGCGCGNSVGENEEGQGERLWRRGEGRQRGQKGCGH